MSQLHVIFKVAEGEYAIPADQVHQVDTYSNTTPVPGAPPFVAGLVQLRQHVMPVINTRLRFGLPDQPATEESRLVVLRFGNRFVSLLVDSAREVQNLAPSQFKDPPELMAKGFVKSVAQVGSRIIMLLDSLKIVGEESNHG